MIQAQVLRSISLVFFMMLASPAWSALTGIYVEYWVPPAGNPCGTNPASPGDGWFPVPGFPNRGATCPGFGTPQSGLAYGSPVTFTGNSGTTYRVFAVDPDQTIGNITVNGSGYTLLVGRSNFSSPPFTDPLFPLPVAGGGAVGTINAFFGTVQIRVTNSVGSVGAGSVVRIDSRGSTSSVSSAGVVNTVRAPRINGPVTGTQIDNVIVLNWDSGPTVQDLTSAITATSGNIGQVNATGARILGNITADNGGISSVLSTVAVGPASGSPVTVRAKNGSLDVTAPSINANIDVRFGGGTGVVRTLSCTGNFQGSLTAAGIGVSGSGGFTVSGNLLANIDVSGGLQRAFSVGGSTTSSQLRIAGTIAQAMTFTSGVSSPAVTFGAVSAAVNFGTGLSGALTVQSTQAGSSITSTGSASSGSVIRVLGDHAGALTFGGGLNGLVLIDGSLASTGSITTGSISAPGLPGQIIINGAGTSGQWLGNVRVGGTGGLVVGPPSDYSTLSSVLGGGAIGLVPFALHDEDCSPISGASLSAAAAPRGATSGGGAAVPIRLRHYGPVTWDPLNGDPYRVERRPLAPVPADIWTDESACFTQTRDSLNPTIILLTPALDEVLHPGFEYRAVLRQSGSPASNVLRCELPSGARPAVADQTPAYAITVGVACLGDANSDGVVNFSDVTSVLANFGSASTGCLDLVCGDSNRDGVVNFTDNTTTLASFGNTCPENASVPCEVFPIPGGDEGGEGLMAGGANPGVVAILEALSAMGYQGIDDFVSAIAAMTPEERNAEVQRLGRMLMDASEPTE